jgi:hypothetical protein
MEASHVENVLPLALPALFYLLFAQTVIPVPTEFSDSIPKETKFAIACLDILPIQMEIVFNLIVLLILIVQLARLF